ncbi:MAG: hypothetical protein U9O78_04830 [Patescibacteria group bacterium]|nr:hypothetical protein [Patescibacteria group bacterium]
MSKQSAQSYTNQTDLFTSRFSSKTKSFLRKGVAASAHKQPKMSSQTTPTIKQNTNLSGASSSQTSVLPENTHNLSMIQKISTSEKLDLLDGIVKEFEQNQAVAAKDRGLVRGRVVQEQLGQTASQPTQLSQPTQPVQPTQSSQPEEIIQTQARSARKEGLKGAGAGVEAAASIQFVEHEKSSEIPPEVEKFIKKVEDKKIKAPEEIVVAAQSALAQDDQQFAAEPVVVLPITPKIEAEGEKKPPKFSIRWLVEWSKKIVKMFAGKVIYRQPAKS